MTAIDADHEELVNDLRKRIDHRPRQITMRKIADDTGLSFSWIAKFVQAKKDSIKLSDYLKLKAFADTNDL